ncbi:MAG: RluA family pseudouridine synthase [Armatimonadota bacterium]|nr:RluA family pseudouridine synthase [Armatimonadota bacterium]MDR7427921.1 RluA family pseudouridine synthase [Armatimonadota bacterium]MDR7464190.1 RluA family pseudouridine synthase [Armatimonadota bacterium]MDR7470587.1 RluA family pseudouridine synthase [Armatimonadota bacterium]MDR7475703.1 RluA family pseudouridine synthase [Armatimonadota bacterium]
MGERKRLAVDAAHDGSRLDVFLHARLPELSRSRIHALIVSGHVRVQGEVRKPAARVRRGQEVTVEIPAPSPSALRPEPMPLDVRYEDADLLVVNKPPGLVVHPGPGHPGGTLVNAILARVPGLAGIGGVLRPGVVHRLDKDTSGLLVVAKNEATLRALQAAIKARAVTRCYLALVHGHPVPQEGTIEAPIARHPHHRQRMAVVPEGRAAVTRYRVVEQFPAAALVEATLLTGRTHQLRVHFAHIGHPVVGDRIYGRRRETWGMDRQALHAYRLTFTHPRSGAPVDVEAPLPEDMTAALDRLRG